MNAFTQIGTFVPDNLISGNEIPLLTKRIKLEVGNGTLLRGSVISINGKLANMTTTGAEPNITTVYDTVDGILTDDVEFNDEKILKNKKRL